jgi:hypothetical protein
MAAVEFKEYCDERSGAILQAFKTSIAELKGEIKGLIEANIETRKILEKLDKMLMGNGTLGFIARVINLEAVVTDLQIKANKTKEKQWQVVLRVLPWVLTAASTCMLGLIQWQLSNIK